jgi:hypothetical protein
LTWNLIPGELPPQGTSHSFHGMTERRYTDDEVDAIFTRASEVEQEAPQRLQSAEGRTLAELQAIGREAGLSPEAVAQAARALDQPAQPIPARFLGLPLGVARTVTLDRRLTDQDWERLVVQLRETFNARGVLRNEGSFRSWSNGNLQVLLEPDGAGHRVRFRTMNGQSRALMLMGLGIVGVSLATTIAGLLTPGAGALSQFGTLTLIGVAAFAYGALRLPWWARMRQHQMEKLSQRLLESEGSGT